MERLRRILADANAQAVTALRGDDLEAMKAALTILEAALKEVKAFEDELRRNGVLESDIDAHIEQLPAGDVAMLLRNVKDQTLVLEHRGDRPKDDPDKGKQP